MTIEHRLERILHHARELLKFEGEAFDASRANAIRLWIAGADSMLGEFRARREHLTLAHDRDRIEGDPSF